MIAWWWLVVEPFALAALSLAVCYPLFRGGGEDRRIVHRGTPVSRQELPPAARFGSSCKTRDGVCPYTGCTARGHCLAYPGPVAWRGRG